MIRPDPEREGVFVVDVSEPIMSELRAGWSRPVRFRIEDDELVMRDVDADLTRWSIVMPTEDRGSFDVELSVATREPDVVAAIEKAAANVGLELRRRDHEASAV